MVALESSSAVTYLEESQALHSAVSQVCKEEGLPVLENKEVMLKQLAAKCPQRLQEVLREALPRDVRAEAIQAEVGVMREEVQELQATMASQVHQLNKMKDAIAELKGQLPLLLATSKAKQYAPPADLPRHLTQWWANDMKWKRRTPTDTFMNSLLKWLCEHEG